MQGYDTPELRVTAPSSVIKRFYKEGKRVSRPVHPVSANRTDWAYCVREGFLHTIICDKDEDGTEN